MNEPLAMADDTPSVTPQAIAPDSGGGGAISYGTFLFFTLLTLLKYRRRTISNPRC